MIHFQISSSPRERCASTSSIWSRNRMRVRYIQCFRPEASPLTLQSWTIRTVERSFKRQIGRKSQRNLLKASLKGSTTIILKSISESLRVKQRTSWGFLTTRNLKYRDLLCLITSIGLTKSAAPSISQKNSQGTGTSLLRRIRVIFPNNIRPFRSQRKRTQSR